MRALAVLPVVLLTGCGVAGTQFHPGVAAQVGDETITTRHVDDVTENYCSAIEKVSKGQPQAAGDQETPLRYLSHEFTKSLVTQAAAEQLADELGVTPSKDYQDRLAQLEPQLEPLDEDEKEAVRDVVEANAYADDVLAQIGAQELEDQGTSNASPDDQLAAGQKKLSEWVADHDVEINPKYAIDYGTADQVDTDLSYAVSDRAKQGMAAQVDAAYASSLPDNLVCLN